MVNSGFSSSFPRISRVWGRGYGEWGAGSASGPRASLRHADQHPPGALARHGWAMNSHRCANPPTSLPAGMLACFLPPPRLSESFCGPWFRTFGADWTRFRTALRCARVRPVLPPRAEPLGSLGGLAHRPGLRCGRGSSFATLTF